MKSRLGFVRKTMGITYISELILLRKKMGVGQKVDQDEKKKTKKKPNFWPLSESLSIERKVDQDLFEKLWVFYIL